MKIITHYEYPPIPIRSFDWSAVTDNYEPGHPVGHGRTEQEAIADLKAQLEDEAEADAYTEGQAAFHADVPLSQCPYEDGTLESVAWHLGWVEEEHNNGQFGVGA